MRIQGTRDKYTTFNVSTYRNRNLNFSGDFNMPDRRNRISYGRVCSFICILATFTCICEESDASQSMAGVYGVRDHPGAGTVHDCSRFYAAILHPLPLEWR